MEPIPETAAFFDEFGELYDTDLLRELELRAESVRQLVPDLVGLSLAAMEDGVTFTMVATDAEVAVLDAIQYIAGGPCQKAPRADQVVEYHSDEADDERRWQVFASATAAKAVAATLTLPVMDEGKVVGSINLYAAAARAFDGLHEEIADVFQAWAPGAVTNADLSFRTRDTAEHAREAMRASMRVDIAVGFLMSERSVDADTARGLLEDAARRAGVPVEAVAETVLEIRRSWEEPEPGGR